MAEEIAFENGRISNFKGFMTLTLDWVILHTVVHHSSTSIYMPNFIEIDKNCPCGQQWSVMMTWALRRTSSWQVLQITHSVTISTWHTVKQWQLLQLRRDHLLPRATEVASLSPAARTVNTATSTTKGSAIIKRPKWRSVSVEMLFYCCTNNANRSCVSLRSTINNTHFLFGYLHSSVNASLQ